MFLVNLTEFNLNLLKCKLNRKFYFYEKKSGGIKTVDVSIKIVNIPVYFSLCLSSVEVL